MVNKNHKIIISLVVILIMQFSISFDIYSEDSIPSAVIIDEMEDLNIWDFSYGADLTVDTENKISGDGSLNLVSNGITNGYFAFESKMDVDLSSSNNFEYNFYIKDKSEIASIAVVLFTDISGYSSYYANYLGNYEMVDGWNTVRRSVSDFYQVGSDGLDKIKAVRFVVNYSSSDTININFDKIQGNIESKSEVLFSFEDGYYDTYSKAFPILEEKGFKATVWPIKEIVSYEGMDYLDLVDLENLYRAGWDIGNSTESYPVNFESLTYDEKLTEYKNAKNWLVSNGWDRALDIVSYPMGYYDEEVVQALESLDIKGGIGDSYGIQSKPVENLYNIKTINIGSYESIDNIKEEIDRGILTGSSIVLTFHKIKDVPLDSYETSTSKLKEIVDYVYEKQSNNLIDVSTISKWFNEYNGSVYTVPEIKQPVETPQVNDYTRIINIDKYDTPLKTSNGSEIDAFESIDLWNNVRRGTAVLDSENKMEGNSSLKLSSQVVNGGGTTIIEKTNIGTLDLSSIDNLQMGFYTDNPSQIKSISVALYSDDIFHSNYFINYIGAYELDQGWNKIIRNVKDFKQNGEAADLSNIKCIRISVNANTGYNPVVGIDDFRYDIKGKSKMVFTFDDAWKDVLTNGYSIMEEKGYKGTLWAVKEFAENEPEEFLTVAELNTMYNNGWDIGNHSIEHLDTIAELPDEQAKMHYEVNLNWLNQNGWTRASDHVCYPQGSHDLELVEVLKSIGVKTARTTVYGITPVSTEDIYRLKTIPVGKDVPMDLIKSEIDKAVLSGSSIMFMYHRVEGNPVDVYSISIESFQEIVDYIYEKDLKGELEVETISEWYNDYMGIQ